jgi:hypothetical protein
MSGHLTIMERVVLKSWRIKPLPKDTPLLSFIETRYLKSVVFEYRPESQEPVFDPRD